MSPFSSIGSGAFTKRHSDAIGAQSHEHQKALQEQIRKNIALENRIRRLAFEQQRAQKLTDIATQKAGKLLDSRDRHVKQIEEKLFVQEQRRRQEEDQRIRNLAKRTMSLQVKEDNYNALRIQNQVSQSYVLT